MTGLRLYKIEKLCSPTAIDILFSRDARDSASALAYPWRAVWRRNDRRAASATQFLISVPKKRIRKAVGRVLMRRRCREAFRLTHNDILPRDARLDIAFIYVADAPTDYARTHSAISRLLRKIAASIPPKPDCSESPSPHEPL